MKYLKRFEKTVNNLNVSNHIKIVLKNSFKRLDRGTVHYQDLKNNIYSLYVFDMIHDDEYDELLDLLFHQQLIVSNNWRKGR